MSINLGSNRRSRSFNSEINVTPFVDVMLVLLVIFMIATPMMVTGIEVNLPAASTKSLSSNNEPIVVSITKEGKIYLQELLMDGEENLTAKLMVIIQENPDAQIFVRGDRAVDYGRVLGLFSMVRNAGIANVSLITEDVDGS